MPTSDAALMMHPPGAIRLGTEAVSRRPFDIALDALGRHVFLPGLTGEGKTTTIIRLADGALFGGYGVVIVDCKGGLGDDVRALAQRHGVPLSIVSPTDPTSLGYNPCTGDPIDITNKLIGAFQYEGAAEVFGTRKAFQVTVQTDFVTGQSEKGSARRVDEYRVHPNVLRSLPVGQVVVRTMPGNSHTKVQVYRQP